MEKNRNKKLITIVILSIVCSLTIGFATLSSTLNITSNATVSPNSNAFGVKFSTKQDSLVEAAVKVSDASSGVPSADGMISNVGSPTLSNLSATFTKPGQYAEYTIYARNEGEYKAYLNSVNFIGEKICTAGSSTTASLVEAACRSINMTVTVGNKTYDKTTPISGHALDPDKGEKVVVRLSYDPTGTRADGSFSIKFGDVTMVYSTVDDSTYVPPVSGPTGDVKTLYNIMKSAAQSDADVNFDEEPVAGVYTINSTIGNTNPIHYYRGAVTNNNVLFADKCWKAVITTESGGVKLIYNGTPAEGKCLGTDPTIGNSAFNTNSSTTSGVRYIYADGTDSTIKGVIDTWYENNMTSHTSKLEDTPWCMDLSISRTEGPHTYYGAVGRNFYGPFHPSVLCPAEYQLKVSATDPGLKLKYPIALITADEVTLAGAGLGYLNINDYWKTLSPGNFLSDAEGFEVWADGILSFSHVHLASGVRPVISLKPGTVVGAGDGTVESPYIVG